MAQNSNREQGAKTTAVEAEVLKTAALDRMSGAPYSAMLQIILLVESRETIHRLGTTADDCAKQLDFSEAGQQTVSGEQPKKEKGTLPTC